MDLQFRFIHFLGLLCSIAAMDSCHRDRDCPEYAECACCWHCRCILGSTIYKNGTITCFRTADDEYIVATSVFATIFFLITFASALGIFFCLRRRRIERANQRLMVFSTQPVVLGAPAAPSYQATYSVPLYPDPPPAAPPHLYQSQGPHPEPPPPYSQQYGK